VDFLLSELTIFIVDNIFGNKTNFQYGPQSFILYQFLLV